MNVKKGLPSPESNESLQHAGTLRHCVSASRLGTEFALGGELEGHYQVGSVIFNDDLNVSNRLQGIEKHRNFMVMQLEITISPVTVNQQPL